MTVSSEARQAIVGATIGLLYGSLLAFLSLLATGAGHGSIVPLLLSSAPLGVLDRVGEFAGVPYVGWGRMATLLAAPPLWAVLGCLIATSSSRKGLGLTRALVLLHYVSGVALVAAAGEELAHLQRLLRISPEFVSVWAAVYLAGQVMVWWRISRRSQL